MSQKTSDLDLTVSAALRLVPHYFAAAIVTMAIAYAAMSWSLATPLPENLRRSAGMASSEEVRARKNLEHEHAQASAGKLLMLLSGAVAILYGVLEGLRNQHAVRGLLVGAFVAIIAIALSNTAGKHCSNLEVSSKLQGHDGIITALLVHGLAWGFVALAAGLATGIAAMSFQRTAVATIAALIGVGFGVAVFALLTPSLSAFDFIESLQLTGKQPQLIWSIAPSSLLALMLWRAATQEANPRSEPIRNRT